MMVGFVAALGGLVVISVVAVLLALRLSRFRKRFGSVIDTAAEVDRIQRQLEQLVADREQLERDARARSDELTRAHEAAVRAATAERARVDADARQRREALDNDYSTARALYDRLRGEVSLLEENLEDLSYGLYRPHYTFDTSEKYKAALDKIWEQQKALVRAGQATRCPVQWRVGDSLREGERLQKQQAKLMLRAFNGECEAAVARVAWNNAPRMEERIRKSFEAINALGTVMHVTITDEYLNLALAELRLTYELEQKKRDEAEEQRQIREQMREEERAVREAEKAREEAEKEEQRYQKALEKAQAEVARAKGAELDKLNARIQQLQQSLDEAQKMKERAVSLAQLTKSGHVYVISNIGSFGENVFKIGMTRRLDPMERVKELGDASVPFEFDVHAMVYSKDAPGLENAFHRHFSARRVNMINNRKEFFQVELHELEAFVTSRGMTLELTKLAEAREYRQTLALRAAATVKQSDVAPTRAPFPNTLPAPTVSI